MTEPLDELDFSALNDVIRSERQNDTCGDVDYGKK